MEVIGLEKNYYLSGNDIWIKVNGFSSKSAKLELKVTNVNTQQKLSVFTLYPSLDDDYYFNICLLIRALFPEPNHLSNPLNTLQEFEILLTATLENNKTEIETLYKSFIRGGVEKYNAAKWHLDNKDKLVVNSWVEWSGVDVGILPKKIENNRIINYSPTDVIRLILKNKCQYKLIKFLNSLGGYQYWVFESFEIKTKIKADKVIHSIQENLQQDGFKNIGISSETKIELYTRTPAHLQSIITDLIQSVDAWLYNPEGTNNSSKWQKLILEDNDSIENSFDSLYENKITYSFNNRVNRSL